MKIGYGQIKKEQHKSSVHFARLILLSYRETKTTFCRSGKTYILKVIKYVLCTETEVGDILSLT